MTRYGLMMLVFMSFHQRSIVAQNKALVRRLSYRTMVSIIPRSNTQPEELVLYQCIEKATGELAGIKAAVKSALKSYESRVQNAEQKRKDADDKIKKLEEKLDDQKENVQELKLQLKEAKAKSEQLKTQIIKLKKPSNVH